MIAMEEEAKKAKADKDEFSAAKVEKLAVFAYEKWKNGGRKMNGDKPKFEPAGDAVHILRFLHPKIDPKGTMSHHSGSGKKSVEWLVGIAGGTTWETEMDQILEKSIFSSSTSNAPIMGNSNAPATTDRLF